MLPDSSVITWCEQFQARMEVRDAKIKNMFDEIQALIHEEFQNIKTVLSDMLLKSLDRVRVSQNCYNPHVTAPSLPKQRRQVLRVQGQRRSRKAQTKRRSEVRFNTLRSVDSIRSSGLGKLRSPISLLGFLSLTHDLIILIGAYTTGLGSLDIGHANRVWERGRLHVQRFQRHCGGKNHKHDIVRRIMQKMKEIDLVSTMKWKLQELSYGYENRIKWLKLHVSWNVDRQSLSCFRVDGHRIARDGWDILEQHISMFSLLKTHYKQVTQMVKQKCSFVEKAKVIISVVIHEHKYVTTLILLGMELSGDKCLEKMSKNIWEARSDVELSEIFIIDGNEMNIVQLYSTEEKRNLANHGDFKSGFLSLNTTRATRDKQQNSTKDIGYQTLLKKPQENVAGTTFLQGNLSTNGKTLWTIQIVVKLHFQGMAEEFDSTPKQELVDLINHSYQALKFLHLEDKVNLKGDSIDMISN